MSPPLRKFLGVLTKSGFFFDAVEATLAVLVVVTLVVVVRLTFLVGMVIVDGE
jgi:hypothetical protein